MKRLCAFSMCAVLLVGLTATAINADEGSDEAVKLTDCPKAVQKTLKRESKGGKIIEIEREEEDGQSIYEAEVILDGKEYEVEIAGDGTLLSKELEEEEEVEEQGDDDGEEANEDEARPARTNAQPRLGQGRGRGWRGGRGLGGGGGLGRRGGRGFGGGYGRGRGGGHGRAVGADPEFQKDRDLFHFLLANRESINRKVKKLEDGVETLTESEDPKVASAIWDHVESMSKRVENGTPIHMRDPLFAAVFNNADKVSMKLQRTKKGVRVTETSPDPYVARLIQAHAEVVNRFLANGHAEVSKNHVVPKRP